MRKFYIKTFIFFVIFSMFSFCGQARPTTEDSTGKGYVGTLPDLGKSYRDIEPNKNKPEISPTKDFNTINELKPVPRDNPAFVNIILKTDKTSKYINDLNEFIPMLENMLDMIENDTNTQVFNAKVYYFNKSADYFKSKYDNKPESYFVSFKKLMELNLHAKSVALLRCEAAKYNPYMAYGGSGYLYNPNSLKEQLEYLKSEIQQTIVVLKEAN